MNVKQFGCLHRDAVSQLHDQRFASPTVLYLLVHFGISTFLLPQWALGQSLPDLSPWKEVLSFRPPTEVQKRVRSQGKDWAVHRIEDAAGKVNLDIYSVEITKFPTVDGKVLSPSEFVNYVRLRINDLVDNTVCTFSPLNDTERESWNSSSFSGSIILIDMKFLGVSPDSGCVVATLRSGNEWIFSTVRAGSPLEAIAGAEAAAHPVSGNRAFGVYKSQNKHVFYTVGADRPTREFPDNIGGVAAENVVFPAADRLWRSLQSKVVKFVNDHGGVAVIKASKTQRYDWDEVKASSYYDTSVQPKWE